MERKSINVNLLLRLEKLWYFRFYWGWVSSVISGMKEFVIVRLDIFFWVLEVFGMGVGLLIIESFVFKYSGFNITVWLYWYIRYKEFSLFVKGYFKNMNY